MKNAGWISADILTHINPQPIPLIKVELDDYCTTHIIKVKMLRNPSSAASEMYNVNMNMFDDGQPEEVLSLFRNFKIAFDGTITTNQSSWLNYLRTMLHVQALRQFDELQSQYGGATNKNLNIMQEVLLKYFFSINMLCK